MKRSGNFKALARAVSVVGAVIILVSGVTFAALQSQQIKLTGNTIETATASLLISSDGINYAASQGGFDFSNLIPGGPAAPQAGYSFFLKNGGGAPLALKLAVSSSPSNPDAVDLSKVNVILTPASGGTAQSFTLASLIASNTTGGSPITAPSELFVGNTTHLTLQVSMAADAIIGSNASLGNIDFAFTGQAMPN
ncbi:MAG TPA: hypothetical protein VK712_00795 [Verrucomicrobiae bacterium]|jgi:hypothetical protein|nr:hypothetical protein [Verrucomicrobiae bacterium]